MFSKQNGRVNHLSILRTVCYGQIALCIPIRSSWGAEVPSLHINQVTNPNTHSQWLHYLSGGLVQNPVASLYISLSFNAICHLLSTSTSSEWINLHEKAHALSVSSTVSQYTLPCSLHDFHISLVSTHLYNTFAVQLNKKTLSTLVQIPTIPYLFPSKRL